MHYLLVKIGYILVNNRYERCIPLIKKFLLFAVTMTAGLLLQVSLEEKNNCKG